jgi:hypothetical protein
MLQAAPRHIMESQDPLDPLSPIAFGKCYNILALRIWIFLAAFLSRENFMEEILAGIKAKKYYF